MFISSGNTSSFNSRGKLFFVFENLNESDNSFIISSNILSNYGPIRDLGADWVHKMDFYCYLWFYCQIMIFPIKTLREHKGQLQ